MKKAFLVFVSMLVVSYSANAQWFISKKRPLLPLLPSAKCLTITTIKIPAPVKVRLNKLTVPMSAYTLGVAENAVMKTAQHNMRFRIYDVASYNFRDLAHIYVQQNRLSEAKWFFLQSNTISREQNNDKLTIDNLIDLAVLKSRIGDFMLAQQDLTEARTMATGHGWVIRLMEIQKQVNSIQQNRLGPSAELRYASSVNTALHID